MTGTDRLRGKAAALTALAAGSSAAAAAKAAGVSDRTLRRWRADPEFKRELATLRAELLHQTAGLLSAASVIAVRCLVALLGDESGHVRARAATTLLQAGLAFREYADFEERFAAIENGAAAAEEWLS